MLAQLHSQQSLRRRAGFSASAAAMERIASGGVSYALAEAPARLPFLEVRIVRRTLLNTTTLTDYALDATGCNSASRRHSPAPCTVLPPCCMRRS